MAMRFTISIEFFPFLLMNTIIVALFTSITNATTNTKVAQLLNHFEWEYGVEWLTPWCKKLENLSKKKHKTELTQSMVINESDWHFLGSVLSSLTDTDFDSVLFAVREQISNFNIIANSENDGKKKENVASVAFQIIMGIFNFVWEQFLNARRQDAQAEVQHGVGEPIEHELGIWLHKALKLTPQVTEMLSGTHSLEIAVNSKIHF